MKNQILIIAICALSTQAQSQSWSITGNAGTNPSTNFIGTTDAKNFKIRTNNSIRVNITSNGKIGIGNFTPVYKLDVKGGSINTDSVYRIGGNIVLSVMGNNNCFTGVNSGFSNTIGYWNTATGPGALYSNTAGYYNVATGPAALYNNTTGHSNVATGVNALVINTTGTYNVATGRDALYSNTTGYNNTATGYATLLYNTTGDNNTATGLNALYSNSAGYNNTATGSGSLYSNTTGTNNTAHGNFALGNSTGNYNTAHGTTSLYYLTSGSGNTAIGYNAGNNSGTNPSNFTAIGRDAGHVGNNSNTIEIGNTSVSWIGGNVNWSNYSDMRIKDNIQSNVPGLAFITKLNPVTYKLNIHKQNEMCGIPDSKEWEGKYEIEKITQTGFLAQEVEQAAKEVNYEFNGVQAPSGNAKLYSVQYASFVVPLVKAVQELNDELKSEVRSQKTENEMLKNENNQLRNDISEIKRVLGLPAKSSDFTPLTSAFLGQNSPNPFTEKTTLNYSVPASSQNAELKIYASDGKEVKSFNISEKGVGQIEINANSLAAGIYNYTLILDGKAIDSKQMILIRH